MSITQNKTFPSWKAKRKNVEKAIDRAVYRYSYMESSEIPKVINFWDDKFIELNDSEHADLIRLCAKVREADEREHSDKTCPCCGGTGEVE